MTPATTWPRTVAAVGIIVTLVLQLADTIGVAQDAGLDGTAVTTAVINWFSFFTTLSAVMAVIALLVRSGTIRISAAAYTLVAGVGYFTLLGGLTDPVGSVAWWTNLVLHAVVPAVMLVDLWVSRHGAHIASRGRIVGSALVLPAVWAVINLRSGNEVFSGSCAGKCGCPAVGMVQNHRPTIFIFCLQQQ